MQPCGRASRETFSSRRSFGPPHSFPYLSSIFVEQSGPSCAVWSTKKAYDDDREVRVHTMLREQRDSFET